MMLRDLYRLARILWSERKGVQRPFVVNKMGFDIVSGCQLRCIGCPNSLIQPKVRPVELSLFKECLSHIDADRVHIFRLFNFGEPLLHPNLPGVIATLRESGVRTDKVEVSTNAQHHPFDALKEVFKMKVLTLVAASCDGDGTPEEYERLRPPARWDRLIEFLRRVKELRDEYSPGMKLITRTICPEESARNRWRSVLQPLGWEPQFRGWLDLPHTKKQPERPIPSANAICPYVRDHWSF